MVQGGSNGRRMALAAWAMTVSAAALAAPACAQEAGRSFDIPAQSLADALTAFGQQSGLQVSAQAPLLEGRTSAAVRGTLPPVQALSHLLTGTGIAFKVNGSTVTLEPAPTAGHAISLGPVRVEGQADGGTTLAEQRAGEDPKGPALTYVANRSVTAGKTDTPLIETARTVTVITRAEMDVQQTQSLRDTVRYAPGVYYSDDADFRYEPVNARGFSLDQYLDGLSLLSGTWAVPRVDPWFLDRAEVLEGPASTLYGQGSPGGLLNMVSKRPTDAPLHEVELQTGSYGRAQAAFDLSGPLDSGGTMLYRLTGLFRDTGTQVSQVRQERIAIAPSFTWKPDSDTSLTILTSYLRDPKAGFWNLLPYQGTLLPNAKGQISRDFYVGDPSFERYSFNQIMAGYEFKHRFSQAFSFEQDFRFTHVDLDYREVQGYSLESDGRTLDRYAYTADEHLNTETIDNRGELRFATGALTHTVLLGLDYQHYDWAYVTRYGAAPSLDILTPNYAQSIATPPVFQDGHEIQNQTGLYAQDEMRLGHAVFTIGGRQDWSDTVIDDHLGGSRSKQSDNAFTWHTELLYHFDSGFAPYASYATSFSPTSGTDAEGNAFKPTRGRQAEIGLKYQPPGWNALFTASAFNLLQSNVLTTDPTNANYSVQTGRVRSRGLEVSAVASPVTNLSLRASYTYLDNRITAANDGTEGKVLANTPKNFGNAWGDYTFKGPLAGFGLNAGARYIGDSYTTNANTNRIPDYALFDLGAHLDLGYLDPRLDRALLKLNVTNVADKTYVSYCTGIGCRWGEGRTILATLQYRW